MGVAIGPGFTVGAGWTITAVGGPPTLEYLVVAGGGGGGYYLPAPFTVTAPAFTIGVGGAGGGGGGSPRSATAGVDGRINSGSGGGGTARGGPVYSIAAYGGSGIAIVKLYS